MSQTVREVVVIGGGISGLTCAWHLRKAGVDVCLLEADTEVGGCTRTRRRDGFLLEKGPFNVIVRDPTFEALLEDLSNDVHVVTASRAARVRYIYRGGRLHPVPTNPVSLLTTGLIDFGARCRLLSGLVVSARGGRHEETIEQAAVRRVGRQASDTIVSAAIAGIFAGDIRRLSLAACFPAVARVDAEARSLIGCGLKAGVRAMRNKSGHRRRWRGLVSIEGGLGALTAALGRRLGRNVLSGCQVMEVGVTDGGYTVSVEVGEGETRVIRCRRLVVGTSAAEAGRLLGSVVPAAAEITASIESNSLIVLNLGFQRRDIGHLLAGFGFLVPHNEPDYPLMGVLWADSIFPHHAPSDHRLIRVFVGGAHHPGVISRGDDQLVATSIGTLRDLLQLGGDPILVDVCRYPAAIPQYYLGHREKIERLRAAAASRPGLHLIGNYLEGVSLNDCIRLATHVAHDIASAYSEMRGRETPGNEWEVSAGAEEAVAQHVGPTF